MSAANPQETIDHVVRDLDLVVYRLERMPSDPTQLQGERSEIRRELERLRDLLTALQSVF